MIATALTELLGIDMPIVSAPMTPQAGGGLARAVSEAGAFGMLGIEETDTEAGIAEQLALIKAGPAVPFGIGLVGLGDCRNAPSCSSLPSPRGRS